MTTVTSVGAPGVPSLVTMPATRRGIRLPRSAKVITGMTLLASFVFLAIFGSALSPYDPNAITSATNGVPQPPSAAHLLGTTNLQQDVLSQLLTEIVFSYPGIGYLLEQAVLNHDYPLLQGLFLIITFAVLAANLIGDFVYVFLDPRARREA